MHARPRQMDRRTDRDRRIARRTNVMATARRFVLTDASRAKKQVNVNRCKCITIWIYTCSCIRRSSVRRGRTECRRSTCDPEALLSHVLYASSSHIIMVNATEKCGGCNLHLSPVPQLYLW